MKYIPLGARVSSGKSVQVDDDIYEYLMQWNWIIQRHSHTSYAFRFEYIDKKYHRVNMHRVIMELCDKNLYVDHIDHDGLNNQRSNLRICTHSQNAANKKSFGVHSKYKGVCRTHGSWNVCVQKDRKAHQKTFKSEIEAALWYNEKAKELHGEFAILNTFDEKELEEFYIEFRNRKYYEPDTDTHKRCRKCEKYKLRSEFHKNNNSTGLDKLRSVCKLCWKENKKQRNGI